MTRRERRCAPVITLLQAQSIPGPTWNPWDFSTGTEMVHAGLVMSLEEPFDLSAETLRRLEILSVLYNQRRTDEDNSKLTSRDLELKMGAPRGSLNFALWYLKSKAYISREDSCAYCISAEGVDHLEERARTGRISGFLAEQETPSEERCAVLSAQLQDAVLN